MKKHISGIILSISSIMMMTSCANAFSICKDFGDQIAAKEAQNEEKSINFSSIPDQTPLFDRISLLGIYGQYGSNKYPAECSLIDPDGNIHESPNDYFIEKEGNYTILAVSSIEGEQVRATKNFKASGYSAKNLFESMNATFLGDDADYSENIVYGATNKGVSFKLSSSNSYLRYRNIINLNEVDGNFIELCANPNSDKPELRRFKITLTDVYDKNNKFSVVTTINDTVDYPTMWGHGTINDFAQVEYNGRLLADTSRYPALGHATVLWDQSLWTTFEPYNKADSAGNYLPVSYYYDCDDKAVKAAGYAKDHGNVDEYFNIYDLDDKEDGVADFPGFTTGEVYITIESHGYGGGLVIGKIGNDILSSPDEGLFIENTGEVATKQYDFPNMITGAVGYYYPLPDLSYSEGEVSKHVYYTSGGAKEEVEVGDFSSFYPTKSGSYRLEIETKNYFNQKLSFSGDFMIEDKPIDLIDNSGFSLSVKLFDRTKVPSFTYAGGNGELKKKIELVIGDKITEVNEGDNFTIESKENKNYFRVTVTDQIRNARVYENYSINVDYNVTKLDLIDCFDEVSVIEGNDFTVPNFTAIDYSLADVSKTNIPVIIRQGKTKTVNPGDKLTINNDTTLEFYHGSTLLKSLLVHCLPYDISADSSSPDYVGNQFASVNGVSALNLSALGLSFVSSGGDMAFANPQPVGTTNLNITFSVFPSLLSSDEFSIELYSMDGNKIGLSFENLSKGKASMYVNGELSPFVLSGESSYYQGSDDQSLNGRNYYTYSFQVSGDRKAILNSLGVEVDAIKTWDSGNEFTGFRQACALLTYKLKNSSKGDLITLNKISNQLLNHSGIVYGDLAAPMVSFEEPMGSSSFAKGDIFYVPKAYAYDFFSGSCPVSMSIYDVSGEALANKIAAQSFPIAFNDYGYYSVNYSYRDMRGNGSSIQYMLIVRDNNAPTITLKGNYDSVYNGSFRVIGANVSDDTDSNPSLIIFVRNKDNQRFLVSEGEEVKLAKGEYEIVYYATDVEGNSAHLSFPIRIR